MTESSPPQIALFGGSFNPPHLCHTLATLWVLQTQPVDEVWWIPTFQHAFDKELIPFADRVRMCEKAVADLRRVRIHDIERSLGGESRTIDTVKALEKQHGNAQFWLVIGADILDEVDRWKDWEGLIKRTRLIIIGRRGYDTEPHVTCGNDAQPVSDSSDLELPDISSTLIRDSLSRQDYDAVRAWIPGEVLAYISEHGLYQRDGDG